MASVDITPDNSAPKTGRGIRGFFRPLASRKFWKSLYGEIDDDNIFNGAAALSYYLLLAIFPAMLFFLSIIPYLPIDNLYGEVMTLLHQALPGEAAKTFEGTIAEITLEKKTGLLSFGAIATLWAASSGLYAIMQELNITYDVKEKRPFWKARGTSILLTLGFGALIVCAFALIVTGGLIQTWFEQQLGLDAPLLALTAIFRYAVIITLLLGGFSLMYYFGPDVDQEFRFVTPGSLIGVLVLIAASLGFRFYVESFGDYAATYGSIGAVIVLMLWLYIVGLVILLGSEINAMIEHVDPEGKVKGEKVAGGGLKDAAATVVDVSVPGQTERGPVKPAGGRKPSTRLEPTTSS